MDGSAFDRLSRLFVTVGSRRGLLGLLSGLPIAGILLGGHTVAAKPGRTRHRHHAQHQHRHTKTQRRTTYGENAHSEACIPTGQRCPSKKPRGRKGKKLGCQDCCQGIATTNANGKRVCGCQPNGGGCSGATASSCCSGFCDGATCQTPSRPTCSQTCAGCCDGGGACQPGTSDGVCGRGGGNCTTCGGATPFCVQQTCAACATSSHCAAGQLCVDGLCVACDVCQAPGTCTYASIQDAIDGGLNTIYICAGLYTEIVTIERNLSLIGAGQGDGADDTILQSSEFVETVTIEDTADVTLRSLRIRGGDTCVSSYDCTLTMRDCTVTGCGLGIFASGNSFVPTRGSLVLTGCTVSHNGGGLFLPGGIYIDKGFMTLIDCLVEGNESPGSGGGIVNDDALILDHTIVRDNTAVEYGGGIVNAIGGNFLELRDDSLVTGNSAAAGGGIANAGDATLDASHVTNNTATYMGGGIYTVSPAPATGTHLQNGSTVSGNTGGNCAGSGPYTGETCPP